MRIAFCYGRGLSSRLTRIFTRSTCYHVGFTDGVSFWDMNLIRRRRVWAGLYDPAKVIVVECPVAISREFLEHRLETDDSTYGFADYAMFALRPLYHLFGQSTRNRGGVICSEMVAGDLVINGWPVRFAEVPSPAMLELAILGLVDAIKHR